MRRLALLLTIFAILAGCSGSGGIVVVGTGFTAGAVIPGFYLVPPTGGRAQLMAFGSYNGGVWTVMFKRTLVTSEPTEDRQFDFTNDANRYPFSVCILDNAKGEIPTMQIQDSSVYTIGNEASGADVLARNESPADAAGFTGPVFVTAGGAGMAVPVTFQAAHDGTYVYVLAMWTDASATLSDQKQRWEFDGATWTRTASSANDEDRIALWWPVLFADFDDGLGDDGCLALCHPNRMGTIDLTAQADLWHWKAARSNPIGFADEQQLKVGNWGGVDLAGRSNDSGTGTDNKNEENGLPKYMAENDPNQPARFLLMVQAGTQRAVPYNGAGFAAGARIAGYALSPPTGGRAQLTAQGSYNAGTWRVMFRRGLNTPQATEDRQFDLTNAANVYPFGVAILDDAKGDLLSMAIQDSTVYTFGNEASGADVLARNETPADAAAFTGPSFATLGGTGMAVPVTLQGAYDSTYVYLLARWTDATATLSDQKQRWEFDGATWTRTASAVNDEDRIALWWPILFADFNDALGDDGCLSLCHPNRMGTVDLTARADLWHWKAARSNPIGFADEQQLKVGNWGGVDLAGRSNDSGTGVDSGNDDGGLPRYMAERDPATSAKFLVKTMDGAKRAVPFKP